MGDGGDVGVGGGVAGASRSCRAAPRASVPCDGRRTGGPAPQGVNLHTWCQTLNSVKFKEPVILMGTSERALGS